MNLPKIRRLHIDTETLGTSRGSVILQIAVASEDGMMFNVGISKESCIASGLIYDQDTLDWWKKQDSAIRERVFSGKDSLQFAILKFNDFVVEYKEKINPELPLEIWMNSPSFDSEKILAPAFAICRKSLPWKYSEERDFRTAKAIFGNYTYPTGAHDALVDAVAQMEYVKEKLK